MVCVNGENEATRSEVICTYFAHHQNAASSEVQYSSCLTAQKSAKQQIEQKVRIKVVESRL